MSICVNARQNGSYFDRITFEDRSGFSRALFNDANNDIRSRICILGCEYEDEDEDESDIVGVKFSSLSISYLDLGNGGHDYFIYDWKVA